MKQASKFSIRLSSFLQAARILSLGLLVVLSISSCSKEDSPDPILTVSIESDQTVDFGILVNINGNASSSTGEQVDVVWSIVEKPAESNLTLTDNSSLQLNFLPDALGEYIFRLTATGKDSGLESFDEIVINVQYAPVLLNGLLFEDRTLENIYEDPNVADYKVSDSYIVQAELNIDPDVKIIFEKDASLTITTDGSLISQGTSSKPIIFTGVQETKGFWKGIDIESKNPDNILEFTNVEYGGSVKNGTFKTNINVKNGSIAINNCKITHSGGYGLALETKNSSLFSLENNSFSENEIPCISNFHQFQYFTNSNDYTGNQQDYIDSYRSDPVSADMEIDMLNVPYLLPSDVQYIEAKLTINPGVTLLAQENSSIDVREEGIFLARGTETQRIIIKGLEDIKGYWKGLRIQSNRTDNQLEFLDISNGGRNGWVASIHKANLTIWANGRAKISNVTSSKAIGYGILVNDQNVNLPDFNNNKMFGNDFPIRVTYWQFGDLDASNTFTGNSNDFISGFESGKLTENVLWKNLDVPYLLFPNPGYIEADVVIEQGTEIVCTQGSSLTINAGGSLKAIGNEDNRIIFKGEDDIQGYWQGIRFISLSVDNEMRFVDVSNGGQTAWSGFKSILRVDGRLSIHDSFISKSGGHGIYVGQNAELSESDNSFDGNLLDNIYYHN